MKKLLVATIVLLVVALTSAIILPLAIRSRIDQMVRREVGVRLNSQLNFRKLNVSLLRHFPYASLDLKDLSITGIGPFRQDTLLAVGRASVVVSIGSLFDDDGFDVIKMKLVRSRMYAHKRLDGAVNWNVFKSIEEVGDPGDESISAFRFSLRDVRVVDAVLCFRDDSTGLRFSASPVSMRLKGDLSASQSELALRLKAPNIRLVSGGVTLVSGADALLDAAVNADLKNNRFSFLQNKLQLNALAVSLNGRIDLSNPKQMAVDLIADCSKVQFKDVLSMVPAFYTRDFNNLTASGEMSLSAWVKGVVRGSQLPAFEIKLDVGDGRIQYTSMPKAVTDIFVSARVASKGGTFDNATLDVSDFSMKMAGNPLKASLSLSHPLSNPHFAASMVGRLDLGSLHKVYPLGKGVELSGLITTDMYLGGLMSDIDSQRYEAVDASGAFVVERLTARLMGMPEVQIRRAAVTVSAASMTLGELNVAIGESNLTVKGQLAGYIGHLLDGKPLSGRLYVKSEFVNMDDIMAVLPSVERVGEADTAAMTAFIVPRDLNLSFSTDLRKVQLGRMTISDLSGELQIAEGTASLERLSMKAFGGTMLVSGHYSTAIDSQHPDLTLALDITHASVMRTFEEWGLVQRMVPLSQKTNGDYSMTLDLTTQLDASMSPDLNTLTAQGEVRSANIVVQNIKAFSKLAEVLHNERLRTINATDVKIRFDVADGGITTQPFNLRMESADIELSGITRLDQTIDYVAQVTLPNESMGDSVSTINVKIGGTLAEPRITLGGANPPMKK